MNDLSKEEQDTLDYLRNGAFMGYELIRHPRATVRCECGLTNSMKCELFRYLTGISNGWKLFGRPYRVVRVAIPNPRMTAPFVLGAAE